MSKDIESLPDEDNIWVFESLVNFLHGPLWKLPVSSFMEEKSVVFDPESYGETLSEERSSEFHLIHDEYKEIVDFMLASFMEDLEVSPEQVEEACRSRKKQAEAESIQYSQLTKAALQELSAAEDFDTFRRLMTRKNIDLQLQSLELLVAKYGVLSPSLRSSNDISDDKGPQTSDDEFLQLVLRYSQIEESLNCQTFFVPTAKTSIPDTFQLHTTVQTSTSPILSSQLKNPELLEDLGFNLYTQPLKVNKDDSPRKTSNEAKDALIQTVLERESVQDDVSEFRNEATNSTETLRIVESIQSTVPEQRERLVGVRKALQIDQESLEWEPPSNKEETSSNSEITNEDIEKRREYMRNQRDKLVALKKKERERAIGQAATGLLRPKSAKAAQIAIQNDTAKGTSTEKSLAARRALANRLKQELQNDSTK